MVETAADNYLILFVPLINLQIRKATNDWVDLLGYVHDVCGLPDFGRPYFATEAQAFYLLMETVAKDMA